LQHEYGRRARKIAAVPADGRGRLWQNGGQPEDAMNQVRCPECHALNVTIVDSNESRGVITVQCFDCGQATEIDARAFQVDTGDLPQE
jgi:hypothetical protein